MCGSYGTDRLTWAEIVQPCRLTSTKPLPSFLDQDRYPVGRKAKGATDWNRSPIIRECNGVREAVAAVWGLVPLGWSKPAPKETFDTFNAKVERVREARSHRHALNDQLCLIPAACFYGSTGPKGGKVRYAVSLSSGVPLLLMGLWDYNRTQDLLTRTIITTAPGPHVSRFHNRVPAEIVEAFFAGDVDQALALAQQSNDEDLVVDPPVPTAAA